MNEMILSDDKKCDEAFLYLPSGFRDELGLLLLEEGDSGRPQARAAAQQLLDLIFESMWEDDMPEQRDSAKLTPDFREPWAIIHFTGTFADLEKSWASAESLARAEGHSEGCGWGGRKIPDNCRAYSSSPSFKSSQSFPDSVDVWDLSKFEPFSKLLWLSYPVLASYQRMAPKLIVSPHSSVAGAASIKKMAALLAQALPWIAHHIKAYQDKAFPMLEHASKLIGEIKSAARSIPSGKLQAFDADAAARRLVENAPSWVVYAGPSANNDAGFLRKGALVPINEADTHRNAKKAQEAAEGQGLSSFAIVKVSVTIESIDLSVGFPETLPVDNALALRERSALAAAIAPAPPPSSPAAAPIRAKASRL